MVPDGHGGMKPIFKRLVEVSTGQTEDNVYDMARTDSDMLESEMPESEA